MSQGSMFGKLYGRFRRITSTQAYFPEIDGLRFLALFLVLAFHIHGYFLEHNRVGPKHVKYKLRSEQVLPVIHTWNAKLNFTDDPNNYAVINTISLGGDRGVELFFVISGFILCLPFAQHYINKEAKIDLGRYYLRRLTRLVPPYIIAISLIFLLQLIFNVNRAHLTLGQRAGHYLSTISYTYCYLYHRRNIFSVVTWSMEMEMQFYLVAPLLFRILVLKPVLRRSILLLGIAGFVVGQNYYHAPFLNIYRFMQFFLGGILLADLYVSRVAVEILNKRGMVIAGMVGLFYLLVLPLKVFFYAKLIFPFLIIAVYFLILRNDALKKAASWKLIPVLGGMCYSIYLLHYTIISVFGRVTTKIRLTNYYLPNLFCQFLVLGAIIIVLSSVFYLLVERPFMSKKWVNMLLKKGNHNRD